MLGRAVPVGLFDIACSDANFVIGKFAPKDQLRGFAFAHENGSRLLVECYAGRREAVDILSKALGHDLRFNVIADCGFPQLPPLELIEIAKKPPDASVHVDKVSTNGNLTGWAVSGTGEPATIDVKVDGILAGRTTANIFRADLLKAGLGLGTHAYRYRLPDDFLDGRSHTIEVMCDDNSCRRILTLPYHFNLMRPWVGQEPLTANWSAEDEASLQATRCRIMYGGADFRVLRDVLEKKPFAIFRDLGLQEAYARREPKMPTFKSLIDQRWAALYGPRHCDKADCCKRWPLKYDAGRCAELLDSCPLLLRHFASKLMVKAFADRIGVRTPRTLAVLADRLDVERFEFPQRFVLKPERDSGKGLYLMHRGLNLFDGLRYSADELRSKVVGYLVRRQDSRFIVEEFLAQEGTDPSQPFIPLDYKMHAFGGKVRIIHVDDRNTISRDPLHRRQAWLSRDWVAAPFRMRLAEQEIEPIKRPVCFEAMLRFADTIAAALGDYVRIDFYATDAGPVLGELTTYSHAGVGFTPFGDTILAQAWLIFEDTHAMERSGIHQSNTICDEPRLSSGGSRPA